MQRSNEILIVGAGFAGAVMAQQLAAAGCKVRVIDQREHVGGNAYDYYNEHGVLVHPYGPHIFHTNSDAVFNYLSRFTEWRFYEHRVKAYVNDELYPFPINRQTINQLYKVDLTEAGVAEFLEQVRSPQAKLETSEDVVLNAVGEKLCDTFFRGYTQKQWGRGLAQLASSVVSRIPVRTNDDDRYFTDTYQFMPAAGYHVLFQHLLEHPNITVELGTSFQDLRRQAELKQFQFRHIVFTGPIDEYFQYCFGKLPYRSLLFHQIMLEDIELSQAVGTINYPNKYDYTRITEFKHLTGQQCKGTALIYEYPTDRGPPYYPVPCVQNEALYQQYKELAKQETDVTFVGRLAQYRYYNMDQVVAAALNKSSMLLEAGIHL